MLIDAGCSFVIVGHSERRRDAGETDEVVAAKALAAETAGLTPILCIGETLEQRDRGETERVVIGQLERFVHAAGSGCLAGCVIAYEPVWAIGTGRSATPDQAQEVHSLVRMACEEEYGLSPVLLYGGSVSETNAADLFTMPDVDGALVGGASLKAQSFLAIVDAAVNAS
jgi:triosephosphate isomerase